MIVIIYNIIIVVTCSSFLYMNKFIVIICIIYKKLYVYKSNREYKIYIVRKFSTRAHVRPPSVVMRS